MELFLLEITDWFLQGGFLCSNISCSLRQLNQTWRRNYIILDIISTPFPSPTVVPGRVLECGIIRKQQFLSSPYQQVIKMQWGLKWQWQHSTVTLSKGWILISALHPSLSHIYDTEDSCKCPRPPWDSGRCPCYPCPCQVSSLGGMGWDLESFPVTLWCFAPFNLCFLFIFFCLHSDQD